MKAYFISKMNRFAIVAVLASLIASAVQVTPVYAASITVTSAADTVASDGDCTLREALIAAQQDAAMNECAAGAGADTITFASNYIITLNSQLPVASPITIQGKGTAFTIIQADASSATATHRVFEVGAQGNLTLQNLTVRNGTCNGTCTSPGGSSPNGGGGIWNAGTLTVTDSTISNNFAVGGGGIWNEGSLTVMDSTFSRNEATSGGGGIWNVGALTTMASTFSDNSAPYGGGLRTNGGNANITNSTFSGNNALIRGGGVYNDLPSALTVTSSTFVGNSAPSGGGGIYNGATATLRNTIVANSPSGGNCSGAITNGGSNLDSGGSCGWGSAGGSLSKTDPNLDTLADNGGSTKTHALASGSPAIAKGVNCPATDQRGVSRPQGTFCDIGAFETSSILVNSSADTIANDGLCTLREAITAANTDTATGGCVAGSATGIDSIRISVNDPITLAGSQLPVVTSPMIITGKGPEKTIIQADASPSVATYRVFQVTGDLTLNQLTVRYGSCPASCIGGSFAGVGGGIINYGTLAIINSIFSDNSAESSGGAIFNRGVLSVANSVFLSNQVTAGSGGAIHTFYSPAPSVPVLLTVTNSTFSGNSASQTGGGLDTIGFAYVTNSTFSDNSAGNGGGGVVSSGRLYLQNTIVANNSGGNCAGLIGTRIIDSGGNLSWPDTTCPGINADPMLGSLADNGGLTPTMALLAGSAAIDAADDGNCPETDQRGGTRPAGSHCDIGAYEFGATIPAIPTFGQGPDTTGVFRPSNGVIFLKNQNTTGIADIGLNYGNPGDYPVVGDWNGDGTVTIGIYRKGFFYLRNENTPGFAENVFAFGQPGDQPVAGDWNGDGVDTIGVYRNGQFLLRNSNSPGTADTSFFLGNPGDVGIAGDWNGDGLDTTGVFRPSNGVIFLKNQNTTGIAEVGLNYGNPGDKPVTGDWNDDGKDTIGVYRNGQFLLRNENTNGFAEIVFGLGNPGDMPIAGNWDGLP